MHSHRSDETGDTLLEIIIAIVIIGLSMGVLFSGYSTATSQSTIHQDLVTANGILRGYAEATKAAVKTACASETGGTFTVSYTPSDSRFVVSSSPSLTGQTCPPLTAVPPAIAVQPEHLMVTLPNGEGTKTLDINVRTP